MTADFKINSERNAHQPFNELEKTLMMRRSAGVLVAALLGLLSLKLRKHMRYPKLTLFLAGGLLFVGAPALAAVSAPANSAVAKMRVTPADDIKFFPLDERAGNKGPQASVVFGDIRKKGPIGLFLKLPAGFRPGPHVHTSDNTVVVLQGTVHNFAAGGPEGPGISAGGTWFQPGNVAHDNHCIAAAECLLFVYLPKGFDFKPPPAAATTKKR